MINNEKFEVGSSIYPFLKRRDNSDIDITIISSNEDLEMRTIKYLSSMPFIGLKYNRQDIIDTYEKLIVKDRHRIIMFNLEKIKPAKLYGNKYKFLYRILMNIYLLIDKDSYKNFTKEQIDNIQKCYDIKCPDSLLDWMYNELIKMLNEYVESHKR